MHIGQYSQVVRHISKLRRHGRFCIFIILLAGNINEIDMFQLVYKWSHADHSFVNRLCPTAAPYDKNNCSARGKTERSIAVIFIRFKYGCRPRIAGIQYFLRGGKGGSRAFEADRHRRYIFA
ncbi:hypothetical protein D3C77_373860 [compost metagenome]